MSACRTVKTGVLVIGAGGAGLRAAIAAWEKGVDVLVLSKGICGRSGVTITALTGYQAAFGHADARDTPDIHYNDTLRNGRYLSIPRLARVLADESPLSVLDLEKRGVKFQKTAEGKFIQKQLDNSQSYPRSVRIGDSLGLPIMNVLRNECKRLQIPFMHDIAVLRLITSKKQVTGAIAYDMRSGEFVVFQASAVILATGGGSGLYAVNSNPPDSTGDGYMLAYRAGAKLIDMEFVLFLGHALVWPPAAKGVLFPFQYLLPLGARHLYNSNGDSFVQNYTANGDSNPSRDVYARAVHLENRAGRGTPHGGAWFDPGSIPKEVLDREMPSQTEFLRSLGVDMGKPIEVGIAGHFICGGVLIDEDCRTSLKGLYAAGEVAGGVHGAARIGGNALAELFVFGKRAGEAAAAFAQSTPSSLDEAEEQKALDAEKQRKSRIFSDAGTASALDLRDRLQKIMWEKVSVVRNGSELAAALEGIAEIRKQSEQMSLRCSSDTYNLEWMTAVSVQNMAELANIITLCALHREESRAGHYREDFPEEKTEWHCNQIVELGCEGPEIGKQQSTACPADERG